MLLLRVGFQAILTAALVALVTVPAPTPAQQASPGANSAPAAAAIPWLNLDQVTKVAPKSVVYLKGTVVSVAPPRPGSKAPYVVYLSDDTGSLPLVIFQDTWKKIPDSTIFESGTMLQVFGEANDYKGQRQVEVRQPSHARRAPGTAAAGFSPRALARAGEASYTPLTIGAVNMMTIGQPIRVRGTVLKADTPATEKTPFRLQVQDETGTVEVVYWKETADVLPAENRPEIGKLIEVSGVVTEHKGKFQLRVDKADQITRKLEVAKRGGSSPVRLSADSKVAGTVMN